MTIANPERRKKLRRSTCVPIRVRIDVEDTGLSCERETIVVNLHGALLKTPGQLELGARIRVYVQLSWDAILGCSSSWVSHDGCNSAHPWLKLPPNLPDASAYLPVRRRARDTPNVARVIELNPITGSGIVDDGDDVRECRLACAMHVKRNRRPDFQGCGCSDQCSVEAHSECFPGVGEPFSLHLDEHIGFYPRAATGGRAIVPLSGFRQLHKSTSRERSPASLDAAGEGIGSRSIL